MAETLFFQLLSEGGEPSSRSETEVECGKGARNAPIVRSWVLPCTVIGNDLKGEPCKFLSSSIDIVKVYSEIPALFGYNVFFREIIQEIHL